MCLYRSCPGEFTGKRSFCLFFFYNPPLLITISDSSSGILPIKRLVVLPTPSSYPRKHRFREFTWLLHWPLSDICHKIHAVTARHKPKPPNTKLRDQDCWCKLICEDSIVGLWGIFNTDASVISNVSLILHQLWPWKQKSRMCLLLSCPSSESHVKAWINYNRKNLIPSTKYIRLPSNPK